VIKFNNNVISIDNRKSQGWSVTKTPNSIAEKGETIYREKYQAEYEAKYPGKYLAIDVNSAKPFVADTPESAVESLLRENPSAYYHVMRIGAPGVYRVGYAQHQHHAWQL
jgi:hypothetical protein